MLSLSILEIEKKEAEYMKILLKTIVLSMPYLVLQLSAITFGDLTYEVVDGTVSTFWAL